MITKSPQMRKRQNQKGMLSLLFKMFFDGSAATRGMNKTQAKAKTMAQRMKSYFKPIAKGIAGAFAATAVLNFGKQVMKQAGEINKWSKILGVSKKRLQELNYAAVQNGMTFTHVTDTLKMLAKAVSLAQQGDPKSNEKVRYFKQLGLSMREIESMTLDELFLQIGENINAMPSLPPDLIKALDETFGEKGVEMLGAFKQGIVAVSREAQDAGAVMSDSAVEGLAEASTQWELVKTQSVAAFAPVLQFIMAIVQTATAAFKFMWGGFYTVGLGAVEALIVSILALAFAGIDKIQAKFYRMLASLGSIDLGPLGKVDFGEKEYNAKAARMEGRAAAGVQAAGQAWKDYANGIVKWGKGMDNQIALAGAAWDGLTDGGKSIDQRGQEIGHAGRVGAGPDAEKIKALTDERANIDAQKAQKKALIARGSSESEAQTWVDLTSAVRAYEDAKKSDFDLIMSGKGTLLAEAQSLEKMRKAGDAVEVAKANRDKMLESKREKDKGEMDKLTKVDVDKSDKDTLARIGGRLGGQAAEVNIQKAQLEKLNSLVGTFGSVDRAIQILVK